MSESWLVWWSRLFALASLSLGHRICCLCLHLSVITTAWSLCLIRDSRRFFSIVDEQPIGMGVRFSRWVQAGLWPILWPMLRHGRTQMWLLTTWSFLSVKPGSHCLMTFVQPWCHWWACQAEMMHLLRLLRLCCPFPSRITTKEHEEGGGQRRCSTYRDFCHRHFFAFGSCEEMRMDTERRFAIAMGETSNELMEMRPGIRRDERREGWRDASGAPTWPP